MASGRRRVWPLAAAGVAAAGLVIGAATLVRFSAGVTRPSTSAASAPAPVIRLAVVPFENLTGDRQQDYFSDGLTEELITQLGGLAPQRLRVIARTSIMRYKSTSTPVDQIGRELGVDYVLGGSARRDGARVRVSAQLVQVRDQAQMWSETYDRTRADIWRCRMRSRNVSPEAWHCSCCRQNSEGQRRSIPSVRSLSSGPGSAQQWSPRVGSLAAVV